MITIVPLAPLLESVPVMVAVPIPCTVPVLPLEIAMTGTPIGARRAWRRRHQVGPQSFGRAGVVARLIGDAGFDVSVRVVDVPTVRVIVPDTTLPFDDWAAA